MFSIRVMSAKQEEKLALAEKISGFYTHESNTRWSMAMKGKAISHPSLADLRRAERRGRMDRGKNVEKTY